MPAACKIRRPSLFILKINDPLCWISLMFHHLSRRSHKKWLAGDCHSSRDRRRRDCFEKDNDVIQPKYLGDQIIYQAGNQRIQAKQQYDDNQELFEQVNNILVQLFKIDPYDIRIAVE